ncbi:MAG: hypothetical protein AB7P21_02350 [Lautropia sp.]
MIVGTRSGAATVVLALLASVATIGIAAGAGAARSAESGASTIGEALARPADAAEQGPVPVAALRALYPALSADRATVGESFSSPSLGRTAPDMRLLDARFLPVGTGSALVVALLEPIALADGYRLIELGVLARDPILGWQRLRNLKVRVDDGRSAQPITLGRPSLVAPDGTGASADAPARFLVPLTRGATQIVHDFGWDGTVLALRATR